MGTSGNPAKRSAAAKATEAKPARKKVRVVKVLVQPVVMLDDGDTLTEISHPVMAIPADEWASYSSERFPRELAIWEDQLNEEDK